MTFVLFDSPQMRADLRDYLRICRFDHMTKHVFILPGIALAILLRGVVTDAVWWNLVAGFASAVAIASANYVINEWLDREFDRYHPEKSQRAAVRKELDPQVVYALWALLVVIGVGLAWTINGAFLVTTVLFALAGMAYNIPPVRTKDVPYLDVLSESLNNAIRLTLGWTMIDGGSLPPVSLLLGFWLGGAFLMNTKRLSEYRDIVATHGREQLSLYRASFRHYTEPKLLIADLVYALLCSLFIAVFLIKYRVEYIVLMPALVVLFAEYFRLAFIQNSVTRKPERLFRAKRLMSYSAATGILFLILTLIDIPVIEQLAEPNFITLGV